MVISFVMIGCGDSDYDSGGNRTSSSYSSSEFDSQLDKAEECRSLSGDEKQQCLIKHLGCAAVTGDTSCDD